MRGPETRWIAHFRFSVFDREGLRIEQREMVAAVFLEWTHYWETYRVDHANCHGEFSWIKDWAGYAIEVRSLADDDPTPCGFCGEIRANDADGLLIKVDAGRAPIGRLFDFRGPPFGFEIDTRKLESLNPTN